MNVARDLPKKAVCFSLFGKDPRYLVGALRNVEDVPKFYNGYEAVIFTDDTISRELKILLRQRGGHVLEINSALPTLFHRHVALQNPYFERVLIRDADSRISLREVAAHGEWVSSDKTFHTMHDHPYHVPPIMGGMWSGKGGALKNMEVDLVKFNVQNPSLGDEHALKEAVWPHIKSDLFSHNPFSGRDFPLPRKDNLSFMGQRISCFGHPLDNDHQALATEGKTG